VLKRANMIHKLSNGTTPSPDSLVDVISRNYSNEKTTFIIPLTFPDVSVAADRLTHVGYGGDVWELRVDLLSPENVLGRTNMPSTAYVKQQLDTLQRLSDLPILFTIRTASQGGKFPDDAHQEALKLMFLAIEAECSYIDVEIEWPTSMINEIVKNKANSRIIASFHDWTGNIRWTSQTLKDKYAEADRFGGISSL
jgi:3-dehydroquinate dehydratase type I